MKRIVGFNEAGDRDCLDSLSSSNVRVIARIRPLNAREQARNCRVCIKALGSSTTAPDKASFDDYNLGEGRKENQSPSCFLFPDSSSRLRELDADTLSSPTQSTEPIPKPSRRVLGNITQLWSPRRSRTPQQKSSRCNTKPMNEATPLVRNTVTTTCGTKSEACTQLTVEPLPASRARNTAAPVSPRQFTFDAVLGPEHTQRDVYDYGLGQERIRRLFRGYHATILAYGQTASGKTYTMSGPDCAHTDGASDTWTNNDAGIMQRAVRDVFVVRRELVSESPDSCAKLSLSYLEIYNDQIRDLLVPKETTTPSLDLLNRGKECPVEVTNLTLCSVDSIAQVQELMLQAQQRRSAGRTNMNERSSRSHAVCTLSVEVTQSSAGNESSRPRIHSQLTMVDLAGSERIKQTGVMGANQIESININKDLFVLASVVSALADKKKHVPYRDSKLTQLLRDSLGGSCFTVLIACVSPADANLDESTNTLRYAERSKQITNSMRQNIQVAALSPEQSRLLVVENERLRTQVAKLQQRVDQDIERVATPKYRSTKTCSLIDFSSFEAKINEARHEAKEARERCDFATSQADRWRRQCEEARSRKLANLDDESITSSLKSLDLSRSTIQTDGTDATLSRYFGDEGLASSKSSLLSEIKQLRDDVNRERAELYHVAKSKEAYLNSVEDRNDKLETRRNELDSEVAQMKQRMHLLATELRDSPFGLSAFEKMLQPFRKQASDDTGVEMSTFGVSQNLTNNFEIQQLIRQLQVTMSLLQSERLAHIATKKELERLRPKLDISTDESNGEAPEPSIFSRSAKPKLTDLRHSNNSLPGFCIQKECSVPNGSLGCSICVGHGAICDEREGHPRGPVLASVVNTDASVSESLPSSQPTEKVASEEDSSLADGTEAFVRPVESCTNEQVRFLKAKDTSGNRHKRAVFRAKRMLRWAERALRKRQASTAASVRSFQSDEPMLRPSQGRRPESGSVRSRTHEEDLLNSSKRACKTPIVISNIEKVTENAKTCTCESLSVGGRAEHVDFFLPKLVAHCSCGAHADALELIDPTRLDNVLRDWQVEYLESEGLKDITSFVGAQRLGNDDLAVALKKWRQQQGLEQVKLASCRVALHIWAQSCLALQRSVEQQTANGARAILRPDFLSIASETTDSRTISTLGNDTLLCN